MQVQEPSVYLPEFIPFYPEVLKVGLNYLQGLLFGFIRFYLSGAEKSKSFYFSNKQLAELFQVSETSISTAIKKIADVGLIELEYKIRANGGKIRLIRLKENLKSDFKKTLSPTLRKLKGKKNKKKENNKNIDKSIEDKSSKEYGNSKINFFISECRRLLGKLPPTKYGKERNLIASMVKLLTKHGKNGIKKGREWLYDDVQKNITEFLEAVKEVIRIKKIDLNYLNTLYAWLKLYMESGGKNILGVDTPRYLRWKRQQEVERTKQKILQQGDFGFGDKRLDKKFKELLEKSNMFKKT